MNKVLMAAAAALLLPSVANAATWVATCNDGKNMQYNQTIGSSGLLYMKSSAGTYQIANMTQSFSNGMAVCATVDGNAAHLEICTNKSRGIIYLKLNHHDAGEFCSANVTVQ